MAKRYKTGGRQKGAKNKRTIAKRDELARMIDKGISPLEYMLDVMRDEDRDEKDRLDAAKAAAPYIHPRLNSIEHTGKDGEPIQTENETTLTVDDATVDRLRSLLE